LNTKSGANPFSQRQTPMKLSLFISENVEHILSDWESFALTLLPASKTMTRLQLRDHAKQILLAIASDLATPQTEEDRRLKSQGLKANAASEQTAAAIHGALRHASGFTLLQLSSEFRAMRASVLKLWAADEPPENAGSMDDMARFNEGIDQALAESIVRYSERVERSRDIFLGILGHDLRTPLNAVSLAGEILSLPNVPEGKRIELAAIIRRSTSSMAQMITDLLEYTRSSLGDGVPVTPVHGDVERICKEAVGEIRMSCPARKFNVDYSGDLTGIVDPARMKQLLWNLLNNASQHGDADAPIAVSAHGDGPAITLTVQNYGKTIPAEFLQTIFEPLVRGQSGDDTSRDSSSDNLGLGLYIANQIVLSHKGTLTVESNDKDGTTFKAIFRRNE
jgi:signal transduction histidine kinase